MKIEKMSIVIPGHYLLVMKLNEITIKNCFGTEFDAYVDVFTKAVRDYVVREYDAEDVDVKINWHDDIDEISIEIGANNVNNIDENVRNIILWLWNNPDKWWRRNSEFHPNA